ncbi:hypothetical protein LZQ00_15320 [Sphingobacterium sp. SRCM116780]|uniref:hypothetical protein n=1 Tax=Sphingobacterium sp. SRCM116780 TaxID=2907623 RepID=UPI001F1BF82F|nr:hypothetical protein [Sphingobacterium sp. SRCM116780]UIR55627.1 hypothetical protein LZQ00_15320 [Sphingobacterium sp. SRCM116780]
MEKKSKTSQFLHALGFTVGGLILYGIFIWMMPMSGYAILGYIYITPIVAIGSFFFYFIFQFFKKQQKLMWLFCIILLIISAGIYASGAFNVDIWVRNLFHSEKLPPQYKDYQDINQPKIAFGNSELTFLSKSEYRIQCYITTNDDLITRNERNSIVNDDNRFKIYDYCKYDRTGLLKDRYTYLQNGYKNEEILFQGYLFNAQDDYYKTWAIDGDTLRKPLIAHNRDFKWTEKENDKFFQSIAKNSPLFFTESSFFTKDSVQKEYDKIIYLENNVWNIFYVDEISDKPDDYFYGKGDKTNDLFVRKVDRLESEIIKSPNIPSRYFAKRKYKRIVQSAGGDGGANISEVWLGELYSLLINDPDTLKFKETFVLDEEWKFSKIEIDGKNIGSLNREYKDEYFSKYEPFESYLFYAHPKLKYKLFATDFNNLYMLKQRK